VERQIIYIGDPMCSWCWGFAPVLKRLRDEFGAVAPMALVLGGMRAFETAPMDDARRAAVRKHWSDVNRATGQPFDTRFFDREGFVFDSEPPCRAAVIVRQQWPDRLWDFYEGLHHGFHAGNRDVTDPAVLADIAAGHGIDRANFLALFEDRAAKAAALADFQWCQRAGVTGFPTVVVREDDQFGLLTVGCTPYDELAPVVSAWCSGAISLGQDAQATRH